MNQNLDPHAHFLSGDAPESRSFLSRVGSFFRTVPVFFRESFGRIFGFVFLLLLYIFAKIFFRIWNLRLIFQKKSNDPKFITPAEILFSRFFSGIMARLNFSQTDSIDKISLIELAIRNMKVKRTRTMITVGGMAIGIASIVFLVSLGYGLERLVTSRVANLDEMQQADISPQTGSRIRITDRTVEEFSQVAGVEAVLPQISVVGRVNYQNSVSDMAAYGVTSQYLMRSAIRPVQGNVFESDDISYTEAEDDPSSLGQKKITAEKNAFIEDVMVSSTGGSRFVRLRSSPDSDSDVIGYAQISGEESRAVTVWGKQYISRTDSAGMAGHSSSGETLGEWVRISASLYDQKFCESTNTDCVGGQYLLQRTPEGDQVSQSGYFALTDDWIVLRTISADEKKRLAASGGDESILDIKNSGDGWVEVGGLESDVDNKAIDTVALSSLALREAVVSRAMLRILNIPEEESVGKEFEVSFVITGNLLENSQQKKESVPTNYKIVGVIPEDKTPIFYVPFLDLRSLGIVNYSQIKIVAEKQENLFDIRSQIQAMGYITTSVVDTVDQIRVFFARARLILGLLGMAALGVAALGMFNTLTVSLLERTREVGLMKAIGMRSTEVQELFLTESMVMSFFGGVLGLLAGIVAGKGLGVFLSLFALFRGAGTIDVSYVPISFIVSIVIFSIVVGILTGLYPARRATSISALNALRYE